MSEKQTFHKEFLIHESRIDQVVNRLERLSKTAVKLGLPEFHIDITGDEIQSEPGSNLVEVFKKLTFAGEHPTFSGWRFLAKLEHLDGGANVIKSWSDTLDTKYQTCPPNCDHCNVNRQRNATFLVANDQTGDELQVGSTCVDDFIGGHTNPNIMLSLLNGLGEIKWDGDEPFYDPEEGLGNGGGSSSYATPLRVLEIACAVIRKDGTYFSPTNLSPGGLTTKDEVAYHLFGKSGKLSTTGPDEIEAKTILEWLKGGDEDYSNYRHNLRVLAQQEAIDGRKHLGLLVSAPTAYKRAMATKKEVAASLHVGSAGDKWKGREVIYEGAPYFETQWGTSYNVLMKDVETGGALKWTTSSPLPLLKGQRYFVNGTVKGHDEYNGQKQTVVTRVACPDIAAMVKISNTLLHPENHEKNLKAILKALNDPNVVCEQGKTLLITAGFHADDDDTRDSPVAHAIEALLKAGADPLQGGHYDPRMKHALDVAIVFGGGSPLLVDIYLEHLKGQGVDLSTVSTLLSDSKDEKGTWVHTPEAGKRMVEVAERHGLAIHADTYTSLRLAVPETAITESLKPAPAQQETRYEAGVDTYDAMADDLDDELELNPAAPLQVVPEAIAPVQESRAAAAPEPVSEPVTERESMGDMVRAYVAATSTPDDVIDQVDELDLDEAQDYDDEDAPVENNGQMGFRFG